MSGSDTTAYRYKQFLMSLPGKRGIDIPEQVFDRIQPVADGISRQLWGRPPTPHQLQHLYTVGAHSPEAIHAEFAKLPHPHAPSTTVGEYESWKAALQLYRQHGGR